MTNQYVSFIDDAHLLACIARLHQTYQRAKQNTSKASFYKNKVDIVKNSNGFTVKCSVSGGDMDLMKLDVYAPEMEQALILKKNFLDNPKKAYKIMLALLTKDKETVGEALEELYGIV